MIDGHLVWWVVLGNAVPSAVVGWVLGRHVYGRLPMGWLCALLVLWAVIFSAAVSWWSTYA